MDVFCLSSLYEGTPLALFEAMAAGKAIVSTNVDGCREVLEDAASGVLVPAGRPGGAGGGPRARALVGRGAHGPRGQRARRPRAATTCAPASTRCSSSTTSCCPAHRAPGAAEPCRSPASPAAPPRPGRCPATCCSAATRASSAAARSLPGEVPVFVFHGAEPEDFGRKLGYLTDNGYRTLSVDEYVAVIRPGSPRARAGRAADLRRRPRLGLERGRPVAAPARDAGRRSSWCRAGCARPLAGADPGRRRAGQAAPGPLVEREEGERRS